MANFSNKLLAPQGIVNHRFAVYGIAVATLAWFGVNEVVLPLVLSGSVAVDPSFATWVKEDTLTAGLLINSIRWLLIFGLLWGAYRLYSSRDRINVRQILGLVQPKSWRDSWFVLPAFVAYFLCSWLVMIAVGLMFPEAPLDQAQDLGMSQPVTTEQFILTFITLVVLPPIFEELFFRGAIFGSLMRSFSPMAAALITSAAFGMAHGQLNLFLDTFVLSLFLCYLRYRSGAIWLSMTLHAMKNGLAFVLLYVVQVPIG